MKPTKSCILTLFLLFAALAASAQADRKIEQQKRVIAALEQKIAAEEREISKLKEGRAATKRPRSRPACCAGRSTARTASPETSADRWTATVPNTPKWCAKPIATTGTTII